MLRTFYQIILMGISKPNNLYRAYSARGTHVVNLDVNGRETFKFTFVLWEVMFRESLL
jgi:hypothetical protein